MKNRKRSTFSALLLAGAMALMAPQAVMAAGTDACTQITNQATLSYEVGGVGQADISNTPGGTDAFYVGVKVNVLVTRQDVALVSVAPNQTAAVLNFRVANNGNVAMKYALTADAKADGTADPFGGTDTDGFDGTNITTFGVLGTSATITSLAADATQDVTITVNIPAGAADTELGVYSLHAQSQWLGSSTDVTADGTASGATINDGGTCTALGVTTVDVVVADTTAGDDDAVRDGAHSARNAYQASTAVLTVSKTATTIWDPINGNSSPKSIPGALVRYTVTISNAGTASNSATLTSISDGLAGNITMDPDLMQPAACGAPPCLLSSLTEESASGSGFKVTVGGTSARAGFPKYYTTTSSADGVDFADPNVTATMSTVLPIEAGYAAGQLKPGESVTLTFNVTVD